MGGGMGMMGMGGGGGSGGAPIPKLEMDTVGGAGYVGFEKVGVSGLHFGAGPAGPGWSDAERSARMAGMQSGSSYVRRTTPSRYVPAWLTVKPKATPEEYAAVSLGTMVGSPYVLGSR